LRRGIAVGAYSTGTIDGEIRDDFKPEILTGQDSISEELQFHFSFVERDHFKGEGVHNFFLANESEFVVTRQGRARPGVGKTLRVFDVAVAYPAVAGVGR
jgi:hypothetical protein